MAGVRQDRRLMLVPEPVPGRKAGILVVMLAAVLAAIALLWNVSRRPAHAPAAVIETENAEPATALPPAETPEPVPAVSPAPAIEQAATERNQAEIGRVIQDGRPYLKACYQRALARDSTLVEATLKVRVSIAASGRVTNVAIRGPAAFRELEPCLQQAISRWTFPAESEPYVAAFPIQFRGKE